MLLRYFYDEQLAHASYVVGCQKTGEAVVVDPMRHIQPYLDLAAKEGLHIVGALETHIHADFVTGSRELAAETGAALYVSDEGDSNWKYEQTDGLIVHLLKDQAQFTIGNLLFTVMHTPGHTPESISFLLTDRGGGADEPMGIFTGDFVFVGDVGRPDLLEKAAGVIGTAETGAEQLYEALVRFKQLPDYIQVWPAHGAGSACGKSLGAVPSSTVGYEKRWNWAMRDTNLESFKRVLLDGQPEPPRYFAVMKRVNKTGVALMKELPEVHDLDEATLRQHLDEGRLVFDVRPSVDYRAHHVKGSINVPFNQSFTNWMGWLVHYEQPFDLIVEEESLDEIQIALHSIGIDHLAGVVKASNLELIDQYDEVTPAELEHYLEKGAVLLDVRNRTEWDAGHIPGATHMMLGTIEQRVAEIPKGKPIIVQCQSGARSAIGTSILRRHGIEAINLVGGYRRYNQERHVQEV